MTGDDHNTDALIAALRSPALPAEQVGEAAAVTAMFDALGRAPAPSSLRARRGIAIAAVTVASLGVGGLAAAGPGIFTAAAERARSIVSAETDEPSSDEVAVLPVGTDDTTDDVSAPTPPPDESSEVTAEADVASPAGEALPSAQPGGAPAEADAADAAADDADAADDAVECVEGNHGATVSSVAQASIPPDARNRGEVVSEAARSDCGKPSGDQGDGTAPAQAGNAQPNGNGPDTNNGQGNANAPDTNNGQGNANGPDTNNGQGNANAPDTNNGQGNANAPDTNNGQGNANAPDTNNGQAGTTVEVEVSVPADTQPGNRNGTGTGNGNGPGSNNGQGNGQP